jgi:hypothetical protein
MADIKNDTSVNNGEVPQVDENGDEQIRTALKASAEMKDAGNQFFLQKDWLSAITAYNQALSCLPAPPKRSQLPSEQEVPNEGASRALDGQGQLGGDRASTEQKSNESEANTEGETREEDVVASEGVVKQALTPLQKECSIVRVTLYSNIAACELKQVRYSSVRDG